MRPRNRNNRLFLITICAVLLGLGTLLLLKALRQNTQFFYDPSEILADDFAPKSDEIRVGGLVLPGSVMSGTDVVTTFKLGDFVEGIDVATIDVSQTPYISVTYEGVLPDLFREGQGVVITGIMQSAIDIRANEVLAKHDENYQPKK